MILMGRSSDAQPSFLKARHVEFSYGAHTMCLKRGQDALRKPK